jgi:plastocyanin
MKLRLSLVAALMMMVACGGSPSSPSGGSNSTGTPVSIVRQAAALTTNAYSPNPISISVGGTVTWTNSDTEAHTSTGDDGSWNSGTMAPGATFSRTFSATGNFTYHCTLHPNMIGTVTVR